MDSERPYKNIKIKDLNIDQKREVKRFYDKIYAIRDGTNQGQLGRPKKYSSKEDAYEAIKESKRKYHRKMREQKLQSIPV